VAQLIVSRTLEGDCGQRQVYVDLDGESLGNLLAGERFVKEITAGRHFLKLNNTLVWKTAEFEAEPGAHVHYTCVNRAPSSLYFMLFIFGVAPLYVVLRPGVPSAAPSAET